MRKPVTGALAALAVVAALVLGTWFWAGTVAPGYRSSIALGVLWFVAVSIIAGRLTKHRPTVRRWTRPTFVACAVASVAAFGWTSVRPTTVDETVVTGVPASSLPAAEEAGAGELDPDDARPIDPDDR